MKRAIQIIVGFAIIMILVVFCPAAMALGFSAEEIYNSVFVVETDVAIGSGFAVSENEVITNAHVISDARIINIETYSGGEIPAVVTAYDEALDLAVLYIERESLIPLAFASSDDISAGEDVYAVGAPKSMAYTMTKGIISSKSRMIQGQEYIQVDAAVNEGNSGGPLLDSNGNVLGVITLKVADAEGIGMAIPITVVSRWLENSEPVMQAPAVVDNESQTEENNPEGGVENELSDDHYSYARSMEKINAGLVIALLVSVLLNIIFIVLFCLSRRKKKTVPVHSPDSTDFEIEFLK